MRWIPLALTAFFLFVSSFVMGLSPGDDSNYLAGSLVVRPMHFLHYQDWSPLYFVWFKLLTLLCPNPISRYFLSWGILVILLAMIPTWSRIRSAWIYALILLGFPFLTINPFVSLFGAAILLTGTCLILQRKPPLSQTAAIFCAFAFVVSFARPEFDYGVYLGAAITLAALILEHLLSKKIQPKPSPHAAIFLACVVLVLAATLHTITKHSLLPRSGVAFAQHYNRRAAEHGIIPAINSWKSDYAQRRFGLDLNANSNNTTATLFDFLRANPHHFFSHILENLRDPRALLLILPLIFFVLWPWLKHDARHLRSASIFVLLIAVPCVAATLVIYPRSHYAMVLIPSLILYTLQLFDGARWLPSRPIPILIAGCALIWLTAIGLPARGEDSPTEDQVYLQQVQCTRQIDKTAPAEPPVFESVPMLDIYFIHRRTMIDTATLPQYADFKSSAIKEHPAWISVDEHLAPNYHITTKELDNFLRNDLGYIAHPCPFNARLTIYTPDPINP